MTTVVAVAYEDSVVMAADSLTNVYDRPIPSGATKIRRVRLEGRGEALLGFCGAGGLAMAPDHVTIPDPPDDPAALHGWAGLVSLTLQEWAASVGLVEDGRLDGAVLLGYAGRLWTLSQVHAIPHPDGRAALGSGEGPAIGALDAMLDHARAPIVEAITAAARIAIERDRHSAGPIQIEWLPGLDEFEGKP